MSKGNLNTSGDQKKNTTYQLANLKLLAQVVGSLGGGATEATQLSVLAAIAAENTVTATTATVSFISANASSVTAMGTVVASQNAWFAGAGLGKKIISQSSGMTPTVGGLTTTAYIIITYQV